MLVTVRRFGNSSYSLSSLKDIHRRQTRLLETIRNFQLSVESWWPCLSGGGATSGITDESLKSPRLGDEKEGIQAQIKYI